MSNYLQQFPWGEDNNINTNFYLDLIYQFQFSNDNIFVWFILTVKLTALFPISFMLMLNRGHSDTTSVNADRVVTHRHWAPGRDREGGSHRKHTFPAQAISSNSPLGVTWVSTHPKQNITLKHKDEYSQLKMSGQGEGGIIQRTNRKLRDMMDIPRSNNFHPREIIEKKNWGKKKRKVREKIHKPKKKSFPKKRSTNYQKRLN